MRSIGLEKLTTLLLVVRLHKSVLIHLHKFVYRAKFAKLPLTTTAMLRAVLMVLAALALTVLPAHAVETPATGGTAQSAIDAGQQLRLLYAQHAPRRRWADNGQAQLAVDLLREAQKHGLDPADYDADLLARRLEAKHPDDADGFDRALSGSMLRFLSDLHYGRVALDSGVALDSELRARQERSQSFDPAEHLRLALRRQRLSEAVAEAAPGIPLYNTGCGHSIPPPAPPGSHWKCG